jgi:HEAT repeat protein
LLLTLLGVAGAAALFFFTHPEPPAQHNGRDAYEWATRLTWPPDPKSKDEATTALRALGTNALPLLRQRLAEREPFPRKVRVWLGERLPGQMGRAFTKNLKPVSYASIRSTAAQGLKVLGTNAAPAVPDLIRAMRDTDREVMWSAATALGETGGVGALALIPLLNDPDYNVRHATAYALGQIGPPALAAAPSLVQRLGEKNESIRSSSYYSLNRIGAVAGPAVLKLVREGHGEDRRNAAKALVAVHPRGQLTLPVLLELARDTDAASRAVAIESLMGLRITHPDAMSVYVAGLADTNAAVRLAAANALAQAVHKASNATNALAALKKNDPEEAVRFAAAVALEKIAAFHTPQTNSP